MPPTGRPKEFDPDTALKAAMEHFWTNGYEATGMQALLTEMGVSRQSAYDTFGGKRELFIAAFNRYMSWVAGEFKAMLLDSPSSPPTSPMTRLFNFLDAISDRSSHHSKGCMLTNTIIELAPHDPEIRQLASTTIGKLEKLLTHVLEQARAAGELPPSRGDPKNLAKLIVLTCEGALVMAKTDLAPSIDEGIQTLKGLLQPTN